MKKRIYHDGTSIVGGSESGKEQLKAIYNFALTLNDKQKQAFYNFIRHNINLPIKDKVFGLLRSNNEEVIIVIFNVEVSDKTYEMAFDEDGKLYIEVDE